MRLCPTIWWGRSNKNHREIPSPVQRRPSLKMLVGEGLEGAEECFALCHIRLERFFEPSINLLGAFAGEFSDLPPKKWTGLSCF